LKLRTPTTDSNGTAHCRVKFTRSSSFHHDRDIFPSSSLASILITTPAKQRGYARRRPCIDDRRHSEVATSSRFLRAACASLPRQKSKESPRSASTVCPKWLIPAEHPSKILWDTLTVFLSIANVYATHASIRDRQFGNSTFRWFVELWFIVDILLNFVTEYRTDKGRILHDCHKVWARYLTTWFVIDVLSLFPAEALYIQPIIEMQKRRGFLKKTFFRTKAVVRVTRILRGRHFRLFGSVAKQTKHAGVGAWRLLRLLIKYIPKYLLFFRKMKGIVVVRLLRQVHLFRRLWRNFVNQSECVSSMQSCETAESLLYHEEQTYEDEMIY